MKVDRLVFIVEDKNDAIFLHELIKKINIKKFNSKKLPAQGKGRILGKIAGWIRLQTCKNDFIIVCVDADSLDKTSVEKLRQTLQEKIKSTNTHLPHLIVVPVFELETWCLADHEAINKAFNLKEPIRQIQNVETINNSKEFLRDLVHRSIGGDKFFYVPEDNVKIARMIEPKNLLRCSSFRDFYNIISSL